MDGSNSPKETGRKGSSIFDGRKGSSSRAKDGRKSLTPLHFVDDSILYSGYLYKKKIKTGFNVSRHHKRFCMITKYQLVYKRHRGGSQIGSVNLEHGKVSVKKFSTKSTCKEFILKTEDETYKFTAKDTSSCDKWVSVIDSQLHLPSKPRDGGRLAASVKLEAKWLAQHRANRSKTNAPPPEKLKGKLSPSATPSAAGISTASTSPSRHTHRTTRSMSLPTHPRELPDQQIVTPKQLEDERDLDEKASSELDKMLMAQIALPAVERHFSWEMSGLEDLLPYLLDQEEVIEQLKEYDLRILYRRVGKATPGYATADASDKGLAQIIRTYRRRMTEAMPDPADTKVVLSDFSPPRSSADPSESFTPLPGGYSDSFVSLPGLNFEESFASIPSPTPAFIDSPVPDSPNTNKRRSQSDPDVYVDAAAYVPISDNNEPRPDGDKPVPIPPLPEGDEPEPIPYSDDDEPIPMPPTSDDESLPMPPSRPPPMPPTRPTPTPARRPSSLGLSSVVSSPRPTSTTIDEQKESATPSSEPDKVPPPPLPPFNH